MNSFKLEVSQDKLTALLTIISEPKHFPTIDQIKALLSKNGVVYGIDYARIEKITIEKKRIISVAVAQAKRPTGQLQWHLNMANPHQPLQPDLLRVDFKNLNAYPYIQKNSKIVSINPEIIPAEGMNVLGESIQIDTRLSTLPRYKNLELSLDKNSLIAPENGYLYWDEGELVLQNVLEINDHVGFSTGNLKLKGSVVINGDVLSGFRVEAEGSITINGSVDAANLFSQNGDIRVKRGILGQGKAHILCGGTLYCDFIQDSHVATRKDVIVQKYIQNAHISSGGKVDVVDENGFIRGGEVAAEKGIKTWDVGSEKNHHTLLKIKNYTEDDTQLSLWRLRREMKSVEMRIATLRNRKSFIELLKNNLETVSAKKEVEFQFFTKEISRLEEKLADLSQKETALIEQAEQKNAYKAVEVLGTIYKQVKIEFAGKVYNNLDVKNRVKAFFDKSDIKLESI